MLTLPPRSFGEDDVECNTWNVKGVPNIHMQQDNFINETGADISLQNNIPEIGDDTWVNAPASSGNSLDVIANSGGYTIQSSVGTFNYVDQRIMVEIDGPKRYIIGLQQLGALNGARMGMSLRWPDRTGYGTGATTGLYIDIQSDGAGGSTLSIIALDSAGDPASTLDTISAGDIVSTIRHLVVEDNNIDTIRAYMLDATGTVAETPAAFTNNAGQLYAGLYGINTGSGVPASAQWSQFSVQSIPAF